MKEEFYTEEALQLLLAELLASIDAMEEAPEKFTFVTFEALYDIKCACKCFIETFEGLEDQRKELRERLFSEESEA